MFMLGLLVLIAGARMLVQGASRIALVLGISPLVVGLTVVAIGTSAPELAVAAHASLTGQIDLALGNVIGSNIFNVLFILGVSALVAPLVVARELIRQEVPVMIGATLLLFALALDHRIGRVDGALLVAILVGYTILLIWQSRRHAPREARPTPSSAAGPATHARRWHEHWTVQIVRIVAGLTLLVLGSRWLVDAAVAIATGLGLSEAVVGLTIVAAGTSFPELATSIVAAVRGERDIAVGNVVGSCTFNILGVLGISSLVSPRGLPVIPSMLRFDIPVMTGVALACLPIFFTARMIARWEGALFLAYYAAYMGYLLLAAQQHDALSTYRLAMTTVVLPLTVVTLAVIVWRQSIGVARSAE